MGQTTASNLIKSVVEGLNPNIVNLARKFDGKLTRRGTHTHVIKFSSESDKEDFWREAQRFGLVIDRDRRDPNTSVSVYDPQDLPLAPSRGRL